MRDSELSKIFSGDIDKSIVKNLSHTSHEVSVILNDKKLTSNKKAELLEINAKIDDFIKEFTHKSFETIKSKNYIDKYSGLKCAESRQSAGRKIFVVQWIHPILQTLRFSKWLPAKNVIQADLTTLDRKANELAVADIKPTMIAMPNIPNSKGNEKYVDDLVDKIVNTAIEDSTKTRYEEIDTSSEFDEPLDPEYLNNLDLTFNQSTDNSSSGTRIHSCSSGFDDSGLGTSTPNRAVKEEKDDDDQSDSLSKTLNDVELRRQAFRTKAGPAFNSLPDPEPTVRQRGRGRRRGLRGRRGHRHSK